jgi:hypothetical protein
MDSNGQRFWMWSQAADWSALQGTAVTLSTNTDAAAHDAAPRPLLSLRAERAAPALIDGAARELLAETELARLPLLRDRFGALGRAQPHADGLRRLCRRGAALCHLGRGGAAGHGAGS